MGRIIHSLIWASAIIVAALVSNANGLGDAASFAIVIGLSGAAWAALQSAPGCALRYLS